METHQVSKPNKPDIAPLDLLKYNLQEQYLKQIVNFYNGDKKAALRFMSTAIEYVRRTPKLLECDMVSLMNSLVMVASFRFMPSSVAGEAWIIPYGKEATFQPGYKGYVTLAYRAGAESITADIVRENDKFSLVNGKISHEIDMKASKEERGEAIGAYVKVMLGSGEPLEKYMNAKDILAHAKRFSKAFSKNDSPWKEQNDPELNMWKKTVFIQLSKYMPLNDQLVRLMEEDFKDSKVDTTAFLDAASPAVGKADHTPEAPAEEQKDDDADIIPEEDRPQFNNNHDE